jgi:thioredoxin-like negative regulator of GroEL
MDRRQFCRTVFGTGLAALAAGEGRAFTYSKILWHKDLKTAYQVSVSRKKPMLLVFSASWCTFCHKLLRETLGEPALIAYVERHFVPVLLDYDVDTRIAQILEVESLPCTVVLSPQADLLLRKSGFARADAYRQMLQAALDAQQQILQAGTRE